MNAINCMRICRYLDELRSLISGKSRINRVHSCRCRRMLGMVLPSARSLERIAIGFFSGALLAAPLTGTSHDAECRQRLAVKTTKTSATTAKIIGEAMYMITCKRES
jgi:hypothetical protein